jgi:hypothetical protein
MERSEQRGRWEEADKRQYGKQKVWISGVILDFRAECERCMRGSFPGDKVVGV